MVGLSIIVFKKGGNDHVYPGSVENDGALFVAMAEMFGTLADFLKVGPTNLMFSRSTNKSEITPAEALELDILHKFYTNNAMNMSSAAGI